MAGNPTQKYLANYAEAEALGWQDFPLSVNNAVVIPAFDETTSLIESINKNLALADALVIIVLNIPDGLNTTDQAFLNTQKLQHELIQASQSIWQHPDFEHIQLRDYQGIKLLLIDRIKRPIPIKQGVGLARKIGADIALQLYALNKIASHWLHSTDADATLPGDYFQQTALLSSEYSAACYGFIHTGNTGKLLEATLLYEKKLHYYLAGLTWAGSPYAFPTIGSTLAINFTAYAKVRGFPKRSAAEDFYLLNKLAKISPVCNLTGEVITLQARESQRVPFGTGPAVTRLLRQPSEQPIDDSSLFYHPQSFIALKEVIESFVCLSQGRTANYTCELTTQTLQTMGFFNQLEPIFRQFKLPQQRMRSLHSWFDGFRTLKFIHALRDQQYPNLSWNQLREHQPLPFFNQEVAVRRGG